MKRQKKHFLLQTRRAAARLPVVRNGTKPTFHCQFNTYSGKNHPSLSVLGSARETASAGEGRNPSGLCGDKTVRAPSDDII